MDENGVKNFFSGYAAEFDSIYGDGSPRGFLLRITDKLFRQSMYERYKRTISFIQSSKTKTVLDVGCGSGRYAVDLGKLGFNVTGVDLAEEMLEIAEKNTKLSKIKGNKYILGSYLDIKLDSKFDVSILMGLFDYISNPVDIMKKLKKDTNGYILASFPKPNGLLAWQRKIRYNMRNCQLFYYSFSDIENILNEAKISDFEIHNNHREFFLIAKI